jgi:hypothetical protein
MKLITETYLTQKNRWPRQGRHILAQFDEQSVVVYQAYRPAIGHFAAANAYFGGPFSLTRMSWIKPNFLWMMYRCGWASKVGQEIVLAVRIQRQGFDEILALAVHSNYVSEVYGTPELWKERVSKSSVRLQWDPDHLPNGDKVERRAIQLGLRNSVLKSYARDWIIDIEDISKEVRAQYEHVKSGDYGALCLPREDVYPISDEAVSARLGIAPWPEADEREA